VAFDASSRVKVIFRSKTNVFAVIAGRIYAGGITSRGLPQLGFASGGIQTLNP
jgi:hypothetical protein